MFLLQKIRNIVYALKEINMKTQTLNVNSILNFLMVR